MDHLSRFYCQAIWLRRQISSASELDDIELERAQAASNSDNNSKFSRLEWWERRDLHKHSPPPAHLDALLFDEGFDGERLASLGNFARLAIEERDIEDRRKCILRLLAAATTLARFYKQTQARDNCDCAECVRIVRGWDYGAACRKWETAISRLALYLTPEVSELSLRENNHLLRDQIRKLRGEEHPPKQKRGKKTPRKSRTLDRDIGWAQEYDAGLEAGKWDSIAGFAMEKKTGRDTMSKALDRGRDAIRERESVNRSR